ncbi:MAG: sigma-70 family RNA polymerase sigma factor [Geitlerinemataceae cyanobacterium]
MEERILNGKGNGQIEDRSHGSMSPTDLDLYRSLQSGNSSALAAIYDRYGSLVYGLALKLLTNAQEAEDLTQEIFLALWHQGNYHSDRGSLGGFLTVLTRSRAIDRLRSRSRRVKLLGQLNQSLTEHPKGLTPFEDATIRERRVRVRDALQHLPEKLRKVLEMSYYEDLSQSAIADRLGIPLGTVKTRSRQGLLKLRQRLKEVLGE